MSKITDGIFRTYYGEKRNILKSTQLIHEYLFEKEKSVSEHSQDEADILTNFLRELKKAKPSLKKAAVDTVILGTPIAASVIDKLGINFSISGTAFEKEFEKFYTPKIESSLTKGQQTASVYIELGTEDFEKAQKMLAEYINDTIQKSGEQFYKQLYQGIEIGEQPPKGYFLKVGKARFGKIDVQKGKEQEMINITLEDERTVDFQKALDLLENSSFSIKSYKTNNTIHLGKTAAEKAVSAVANYVSHKGRDYENVKWAGIFYLHHHPNAPKVQKKNGETKKAMNELYQHYSHMRKVYELTGIGLSYSDINDLNGADFLIMNRTGGDGAIKVWSTQALLKTLEDNKYKNFIFDES